MREREDELNVLELQAQEEEWDTEQIFAAFRRFLIEEDIIEGFGRYDE